jgi:integrase/recombinase XerD
MNHQTETDSSTPHKNQSTSLTKEEAKQIVLGMVRTIRTHDLNYLQFNHLTGLARRKAGLKREKASRKLPQLLTDSEIKQFFDVVDKVSYERIMRPTQQGWVSLRDSVMIRVLYFTGVRVAELVKMKKSNLDLEAKTIFIQEGKGSKDRIVPIPSHFIPVLTAYIASLPPKIQFLFISAQNKPICDETVRVVLNKYREKSQIKKRIHPHLFRHMLVTQLLRSGMSHEMVMSITGHTDPQTLKVYSHLALSDSMQPYQAAMATQAI